MEHAGSMGNALQAGAGSPRPSGGSVQFSRMDGPATVNIWSELTSEAAAKLDTFLRELIEEDASALLALNTSREEAKRVSYERERAAQYRNMNNPQAQAVNSAFGRF